MSLNLQELYDYYKELYNYYKSQNKREILTRCLFKALERGTIMFVFLLCLLTINFKFYNIDPYSRLITQYLVVFYPLALVYGIIREIHFEFKALKKKTV